MVWSRSHVSMVLFAAFLLLAASGFVGTRANADTPTRTPSIVYVDPNGGLFRAGKRQMGTLCWSADAAGAMDYTRCCPDGYTPVGVTVGGDLACLMR